MISFDIALLLWARYKFKKVFLDIQDENGIFHAKTDFNANYVGDRVRIYPTDDVTPCIYCYEDADILNMITRWR